jgi:hypothetical protein
MKVQGTNRERETECETEAVIYYFLDYLAALFHPAGCCRLETTIFFLLFGTFLVGISFGTPALLTEPMWTALGPSDRHLLEIMTISFQRLSSLPSQIVLQSMLYHLKAYYCLMRGGKDREFRMGLCEVGHGIYMHRQARPAFAVGEWGKT